MVLGALFVDKFDYAEVEQSAKELIEFFGGDGSFSRIDGGSIDPFTGEASLQTTETLNGTVTPVLSYKASEIDGTVIQQGDGYVFFYGEALGIGDTATLNGQDYRVINVSKIESVEGVLVYQKVQVRR